MPTIEKCFSVPAAKEITIFVNAGFEFLQCNLFVHLKWESSIVQEIKDGELHLSSESNEVAKSEFAYCWKRE